MKDIDKEKNKSENQTNYMPIFMCLVCPLAQQSEWQPIICPCVCVLV